MTTQNPTSEIRRYRDGDDSIILALKRAQAISDLLECRRDDGLDDDTVTYAAQAIRLELEDAQMMLDQSKTAGAA